MYSLDFNIIHFKHVTEYSYVQKKKELGKPRRPLSAFLLFMNEKKDGRGTRSFKVSAYTVQKNVFVIYLKI